jgi:mitochondrial distribution and morphology protein 12
MSIETDWSKLINDEDGLSEKVRAFLDNQFQNLTLPPYIKALAVTSFDFGSQAPEITIKNITDPFPQFYNDDEFDSDSESAAGGDTSNNQTTQSVPLTVPAVPSHSRQASFGIDGEDEFIKTDDSEDGYGPSSLHYFQSTLSSSLLSNVRSPLYTPFQHTSSLTGTNTATTPMLRSRVGSPGPETPPRLSEDNLGRLNRLNEENNGVVAGEDDSNDDSKPSKDNDVQLFLEICYSGNMRLGITATLLINYPSPSFVSLPVKLTVTGLEIRSLAVVAYILNRIHVSLLCDIDEDGDSVTLTGNGRIDVIRDIKIESEIGAHGNGQVLRNVGKVERFVLERLRSLIRDELAWPGWITVEL